MGIALYDQGKLEDAIAELEIAVHLDLSNTVIRNNLEIYRNKKKGFGGVYLVRIALSSATSSLAEMSV
ncbi:hypothetical protein [Nostoc sp. FACHB-888]|uniref:hypothetical protein n=1 Tax=Nostoc sp. FACHB-888 TaxID=2692842 RepID=UPI0016861718|nr:hypothetical protein [Nostoc sp. FACHB-888]MBD2242220.1 hypothetical protein [Nostoc sp. FACHB-888]